MSSEPPQLKLMLIDDEPLLARAVKRTLVGFFVTVCETGEEALEVLSTGVTPDAILCDIHLPDMTGIGIHRRLRDQHPELEPRIVFMTGGTGGEPEVEAFLDEQRGRVLFKPFAKEDLLRMLDDRLNSPAGRTADAGKTSP